MVRADPAICLKCNSNRVISRLPYHHFPMPTAPRILLLTLALTGLAVADLPKKAPLTKYAGLWTNSPFTSKPPQPEAGPTVNPLEDYALAGVSPVDGGYRVTLLNKKKPEDRIIVESDRPREGFKILEVIRKPGDPLGTIVRMSSGSVTGTVSFDEKFLTLAAPAAAKVNPKMPLGAAIPGQIPQPSQPGQPPQQARPRVVPPPGQPARPTTAAQPQGKPTQNTPRTSHHNVR